MTRAPRRLGTLKASWTLLGAAALLLCRLTAVGAAEGVQYEVHAGEPATLFFWNRPIATFYAQVDDITPKDRVDRVSRKLADTLEDLPGISASAAPGTLANLSGYWIRIDGREIFGLIAQDVDSMTGETLDQAVQQTVTRLQEALDARREAQDLPNLLKGGALATLATAIFALALWGIVRLHIRAMHRERLLAPADLHIGGISLGPLVGGLARGAIKLTSLGLGAIAIYVWLTFVLRYFPWTRPWGDGLARFLIDLLATLSAGALAALPGLFKVLVIFVLTRIVVRMVDGFFRAVEEEAMTVTWLAPDTAKATRRLTTVLIWIFALTVAYPYIPGSDSDAFKGISVFVGLMISLGSAGLVNQVMSGLVVAYSRALKAGDFVQVGTTVGTVSEVGMLSTKVVTPKREAVTVPNAVLVGSPITNYSRLTEGEGAIVGTKLTIGYDAPWRQVHAMLTLAAERTPGVRPDPKPFVLQRALADFYPEYEVIVRIDQAEQRFRVLSDLHAQIQDVFNEYGVQIMSPNFETQPQDKVWVPKRQWFAPPASPGGEDPQGKA
jgi:small-conductance mechanosensitive channel